MRGIGLIRLRIRVIGDPCEFNMDVRVAIVNELLSQLKSQIIFLRQLNSPSMWIRFGFFLKHYLKFCISSIRGRSDRYLASRPDGASIAREICCCVVLSKFQPNRTSLTHLKNTFLEVCKVGLRGCDDLLPHSTQISARQVT